MFQRAVIPMLVVCLTSLFGDARAGSPQDPSLNELGLALGLTLTEMKDQPAPDAAVAARVGVGGSVRQPERQRPEPLGHLHGARVAPGREPPRKLRRVERVEVENLGHGCTPG